MSTRDLLLHNGMSLLVLCLLVLGCCIPAASAQSLDPPPPPPCGTCGYDRVDQTNPANEAHTFAGGIDGFVAQPSKATLVGNYPNPFNPETTLRFELAERQRVRLTVFNPLGQAVQVLADGLLDAGAHEARFLADGLPSGTYFARLETGSTVQVRGMILMK